MKNSSKIIKVKNSRDTNFLILILFGLIALCLTSPAVAQSNRLKNYKSVETPVKGFGKAYCADLPDNLSVCKALVDRTETNRAEYLVRQNDKMLSEWKTEITMYSGVEDFEVLEGDLDGDGSTEIIIPQLDGQSNGIGVGFFSIYILPNPTNKEFKPPLVIKTQDFGRNGVFIFNASTRTTDILITYWTENLNLAEVIPKVKAGGKYFVGRWFSYRNGKLSPVFEKPVLARRFLESFQAERSEYDSSDMHPYSWLQNKATLQLKSDPEVSTRTLSTTRGMIEKYERLKLPKQRGSEDDETLFYDQYTVRFDSGKRMTYIFSPETDIDANLKKLKKPFINRIGFLPSRLTLPAEQIGVLDLFRFSPSGSNGIEKKPVTVTTHPGTKGTGVQRILWFDEK